MSGRRLNEEDRVLWTLVARSTTPLKGKAVPEPPALQPEEPGRPTPSEAPVPGAAAPLRKSPPPRHLDHVTLDKLAKGRLPIEGRVDLHGLTQAEAHALLLGFLRRAQASGVRYVMIITGKGSSGEGVLRRHVPTWLGTPAFRELVASHDTAARHHGGEGALYVRLRRLKT